MDAQGDDPTLAARECRPDGPASALIVGHPLVGVLDGLLTPGDLSAPDGLRSRRERGPDTQAAIWAATGFRGGVCAGADARRKLDFDFLPEVAEHDVWFGDVEN